MPRKYCHTDHCPIFCVNGLSTYIIAYTVPAIAMAKPIFNSMNSNIDAPLWQSSLNVSGLTLILFLAWFVSGVLVAGERHTHLGWCVITALGIPGIILAGLGFWSAN